MPLKSALKSTLSKKSPLRKNILDRTMKVFTKLFRKPKNKIFRIEEDKNKVDNVSPNERKSLNKYYSQTIEEKQNAEKESRKELQAEMMNKTPAEIQELIKKYNNRKFDKYYTMRDNNRRNTRQLPQYIKGGKRMSKKNRSKKNRK